MVIKFRQLASIDFESCLAPQVSKSDVWEWTLKDRSLHFKIIFNLDCSIRSLYGKLVLGCFHSPQKAETAIAGPLEGIFLEGCPKECSQ